MTQELVKEQSLHKLTALHPTMTTENFMSLVLDIKKNGQLDAVTRYRGKIVDGRHRLLALKELGEEYIKCEDLPRNMTMNEVEDVVFSSEIRRHETPTQLAIKAYYYAKEKGVTQKVAATKFGVVAVRVSDVSFIVKAGREDLVKLLLNGKSVTLDGQNFTTSLQQVKKQLSLEEVVSNEPELKALVEALDTEDILSEADTKAIRNASLVIGKAYKKRSSKYKEALAKAIYKELLDE